MITLYALEIITIDGAVCEDKTAPSHRIEQLLKVSSPAIAYLKKQPDTVKTTAENAALQLEKETAPLRKTDDLLCRDGMAQMQAALKNGKQHDMGQQPGHVGKVVALEAPPGWTPTLLAPEKYKPEQDKIRSEMKNSLQQFIGDDPPPPNTLTPSAPMP